MPAAKNQGQGPWLRTLCALVPWALSLAACFPITRPVLKIALVAPFDGRYRDVGYEVTFAYRLAIREVNQAGGVGGYSIEMLSLDDAGDPDMAGEQARKIIADPQVMAVIGHWMEATTRAAAPLYDAAGIPLVAVGATSDLPASAFRLWLTESDYASALSPLPHCPLPCDSLEDLTWLAAHPRAAGPVTWQQPQFASLAGEGAEGVSVIAPAPLPADSGDPGLADRYRPMAFGSEPRSNAVLAYDATRLIFEAIARAAAANKTATRSGVAEALAESRFSGLSGRISFDSHHNWDGVTPWVYVWRNGALAPR
jgi:ABC-type branched-subunit amino acid transport system substrate-binding protein